MFKIGQKVVCKDDSGTPDLAKGKTYTIVLITRCSCCKILEVELKEVSIGILNGTYCKKCYTRTYNVRKFRADRFEPLKYDIVPNKEILKEVVEEKADVEIKEVIEA